MGNSPTFHSLSLSARIILLRIIIISSLLSFLIDARVGVFSLVHRDNFYGGMYMGLSVVPVSVSMHHVLRLWPRRKWSVGSDFLYSAVELFLVAGHLATEILFIGAYDIMIIASFLLLSISASFVLAVWSLCTSEYRRIGSPYDFTGDRNDTAIHQRKSKVGRWSLLFGENIFRRRFGIDRKLIRGTRGILSILCLFVMIAIGYMALIINPIDPNLSLQTMETQGIQPHDDENVTMTVGLDLASSELFAVDVMWLPESLHVPCSKADGTYHACNVFNPFSRFPEPNQFIITINYTTFALQKYSAPSLRTGVYLLFNDSTPENHDGVYFNQPTQLYPGFHLFGTAIYSFRDTYANSGDKIFGISHRDRRLVANIQDVITDPDFTGTDKATATLRVAYRASVGAQFRHTIVQEQSSNTVLSGFALLGGVWTFINGLFAAIFGCSLLLVLFGIKPLSIYGLVHLFQRRRSLVDGGYSLSAEEQSQTIAVLREHLLDKEDGGMRADEAGEERALDEERMRLDEENGGMTVDEAREERNQDEERIRLHDIA